MAKKLLSARRAELYAELEKAERIVAAYELELSDTKLYIADEPNHGSVIRFVKYAGGYTFAALNIEGCWFVTQDGSRSGKQGFPPMDWDTLLEWIGSRNLDTIELLS
jgi:hypothetical protein